MIYISRSQKKEALKSLLCEIAQTQILHEFVNIAQAQSHFKSAGQFYNLDKHVSEMDAAGIAPEFRTFLSSGVAYIDIKSYEHVTGKKGHGLEKFLCQIRFFNWPRFYEDPSLTIEQRVYNMMIGNVGLRCSCPAFLTTYAKSANVKQADLYDGQGRKLGQQGHYKDLWINTRPSNTWVQPRPGQPMTIDSPKKNPSYIGVGCKHLRKCLEDQFIKTLYDEIIKLLTSQLGKSGHYQRGAVPLNVKPGRQVSPSAPKSQQISQTGPTKPPEPTDI